MLFPWRFFSFLSTSIAVSGKSIMVQNEICVAWTLHFSLFFLQSMSKCLNPLVTVAKMRPSQSLLYIWRTDHANCSKEAGWLWFEIFFFFFIFILKVDCRFPQGVRKDFSVLKSSILYRLLTKKQLLGASVGAWL
jgi:hypothetical protein